MYKMKHHCFTKTTLEECAIKKNRRAEIQLRKERNFLLKQKYVELRNIDQAERKVVKILQTRLDNESKAKQNRSIGKNDLLLDHEGTEMEKEIKVHSYSPSTISQVSLVSSIQQERSSTKMIIGPQHHSFKKMHELLMTNGEIDIEKILCLHVVGVINTPPRSLEPWGHPVKNFRKITSYSHLLPSYLIDPKTSDEREKFNESFQGRKFGKERFSQMTVIVNKEVELLVKVVLEVLLQTNKEKLKKLILLANDANEVKRIVCKESMFDFMASIFKTSLKVDRKSCRTELSLVLKASTDRVRDIIKYDRKTLFSITLPENCLMLRLILNQKVAGEETNSDPYNALISLHRMISSSQSTFSGKDLKYDSISNDGPDLAFVSSDGSILKPCPSKFIKSVVTLMNPSDESENVNSPHSQIPWQESENHLYKVLDKCPSPLPQWNVKSGKNLKFIQKTIEKTKHNLNLHKAPIKLARENQVNDLQEERESIQYSVLKRVSNQDRILIGNEVARLKRQQINLFGNEESTACLGEAMGTVMSKGSLINLARKSTKPEREFLLKPMSKGGCGFVSQIIGEDNLAKLEKFTQTFQKEVSKEKLGDSISQLGRAQLKKPSTYSFLEMAKLKHELARSELSNKIENFIK